MKENSLINNWIIIGIETFSGTLYEKNISIKLQRKKSNKVVVSSNIDTGSVTQLSKPIETLLKIK